MTLGQFALGAVDISFAAGALYLVLPPGVGISFAAFVGIYVAAMSIGVLILPVASRPAFRRKASLFSQRLSPAWVATTAAIVVGSIWLGIFAFKHVEYSDALWWEFAYRGDAPRFLRASVTVTALALGLLGYMLLRPAAPRDDRLVPDAEALRRIVAAASRSDANLALSGDKRIFMSEDGDAFVMYQVRGRSWIAMGEPVGPENGWEILLWQFREMCDRHGGRPVFYQVGAFSEDYITNFDCAVVRRDGDIVAFANVWSAPAGRELSIDLMRHRSDAPYGIMDFLFIRLMLWGKAQGYGWFSLGMAPLSGLDTHPLAPVWQRIGAFLFRHGEHFYNFEGLRAYKEKFDPVWSPTYLATPRGLALPRILLDITALTSGGAREIVLK